MKRRIANLSSIVWFAIRDNLRSWRYWANRPDNEFTRNGYAVTADFLDRAECGRVRERAERHLPGPSHVVAGNGYTWVKRQPGSEGREFVISLEPSASATGRA